MTLFRAALALALSLAAAAATTLFASPAWAEETEALYCVISEPVYYDGNEVVGKMTVCVPGP